MRGAQLLACVDAPVLTTQPLAVEQTGAGELAAEARAAEPLDRLAVEPLRGIALAQQRPRARLDAERPVGAARRVLLESRPSASAATFGPPLLAPPRRARSATPVRQNWDVCVLGRFSRRAHGLLVASQAVASTAVAHARCARRFLAARDDARAAGVDAARELLLAAAPGGEFRAAYGREVRAGRRCDRVEPPRPATRRVELAGEHVRDRQVCNARGSTLSAPASRAIST